MNIEFHYYIIHYLCNHAGFSREDAYLISYSSQFTDHNIVSYDIDTGRNTYRTIPTQNYGFWDDSFPKEVYIPFHFFPGESDKSARVRRDGKRNSLCCTPNSPGLKELLISSLKTRNPYRIGIALHTYADSWAHQNFSGKLEEWNTIEKRSLIPAIGHAQALKKPDTLDLVWTDPRLLLEPAKVNNRDRVIRASRQIYKYLRTYNRLGFDDVDLVIWKLEQLLGPVRGEKPIQERITDYIIDLEIERYDRTEWVREAFSPTEVPGDERMFAGYDKFLWLKDALLYRSSLVVRQPAPAKSGFHESHFFLWQEAAKEHLREAKRQLKGLVY